MRKNENATATSVQIGPPGQSGVPVLKLVEEERELSLESVSYFQGKQVTFSQDFENIYQINKPLIRGPLSKSFTK